MSSPAADIFAMDSGAGRDAAAQVNQLALAMQGHLDQYRAYVNQLLANWDGAEKATYVSVLERPWNEAATEVQAMLNDVVAKTLTEVCDSADEMCSGIDRTIRA